VEIWRREKGRVFENMKWIIKNFSSIKSKSSISDTSVVIFVTPLSKSKLQSIIITSGLGKG